MKKTLKFKVVCDIYQTCRNAYTRKELNAIVTKLINDGANEITIKKL